MFDGLPRKHYRAILADPPWHFETWSAKGRGRSPERHYRRQMTIERVKALPVRELAADDCVLFLWATWPTLMHALSVIDAWGFSYKTCAFDWAKLTQGGNVAMGNG